MPDPRKLLILLRQAALAFRATPGRVGRVTHLPAGIEVLCAGDMHGNVENFRLLLRRADLASHPHRHLVLQEVTHGKFNYPLGGDKSHQLLDLIAALKCQYPDRVHFLLGNHELAQWQHHSIGKGNVDQNLLFRAGVAEAYGEHAGDIMAAYGDLFAASDLALVTVNRIFVSHSLPNPQYLEAFELSILERAELDDSDLRLGGAVHSLVWGRDVSQQNVEAFLAKVDADLLVSGHIPSPEGFRVPNTKQIILDCIGAPAGICSFPTDRPLTQEDLLAGLGTL